MTLPVARSLEPAQAAELVQVLELEAAWEGTMDPALRGTVDNLRQRQAAFEAYRARLSVYLAAHKTNRVPEITPSGPERLGVWCQMIRVLVASAGVPAETLAAKAYRMADRVAARTNQPPPERLSGGVLERLDAVIAWCEPRRQAV
jgi:hypothetical protein